MNEHNSEENDYMESSRMAVTGHNEEKCVEMDGIGLKEKLCGSGENLLSQSKRVPDWEPSSTRRPYPHSPFRIYIKHLSRDYAKSQSRNETDQKEDGKEKRDDADDSPWHEGSNDGKSGI